MAPLSTGTEASSDPGLVTRHEGDRGHVPGTRGPAIWFFHPRFWDDRRAGAVEQYARAVLASAAGDGWSVYWIGPGSQRIFWEAEPEACVCRDDVTGIARVSLGGRWLYPWLSRVMWRGLRNGPAARRSVSLFMWLVDSKWRVPSFKTCSRALPLIYRPVTSLSVLPEHGPVVSLSVNASEGLLRLGLPRERLVRLHETPSSPGEEEGALLTRAAGLFRALLDVILTDSQDARAACSNDPSPSR